MAEYIDRQAALDAYCELRCRSTRDLEICRNCDEPILAIPTADVVEVVRCKDCAEWQTGWTPSSAPKGTHFCAIVGLDTDPEWYCKDGNKSEVDNG